MPTSQGAAQQPRGPERWDHLPRYSSSCKHYLLQVPREKIGYINAILESFGHVARVFTKEKERGILQITVIEDWDEVVRSAVQELAKTVEVQFFEETEK